MYTSSFIAHPGQCCGGEYSYDRKRVRHGNVKCYGPDGWVATPHTPEAGYSAPRMFWVMAGHAFPRADNIHPLLLILKRRRRIKGVRGSMHWQSHAADGCETVAAQTAEVPHTKPPEEVHRTKRWRRKSRTHESCRCS